MGVLEAAAIIGMATSVGSVGMSIAESRKQKKFEKRRQEEEREDLVISRRMEEGESLAQISGLGVSSKSASIQSFLKAQRSTTARDLRSLRTSQSYSDDISKYRRGSSIFEGVSTMASTYAKHDLYKSLLEK